MNEERLLAVPHDLLPQNPDPRDRATPEYLSWERKLADQLVDPGQRQDVLVCRVGSQLKVLAGETRRRAAIVAGVKLWVKVIPGELTAAQQMIETWNENAMRRDPTLLEQCEYLLAMQRETGWSQSELAKRAGLGQGTISKMLALADLTPGNRKRMEGGSLTFGQAFQLTRILDPASQDTLGEKTVRLGLDREALAGEVNSLLGGGKKRAKPVSGRTPKGLQFVIPALDADGIIAEFTAVIEAVRKATKLGLPLSTVPQLLRQGN